MKERIKAAIAIYRLDGNWEELEPVLDVFIAFRLGRKGFSGKYGSQELAKK